MITIRIVFYNKKNLFMEEDIKLNFPEDMIFKAVQEDEYAGDEFSLAAAEGTQIDYINCRPFDVTDEMRAYAVEYHPELKDKFDTYLYDFIGRHGLGPEYD